MLRIRTNGKSLPDAIGIDQLHGHEVLVGHGRGVGYSEGIFANGLDGTPDVDDLIAAFEEALGFLGEVVLDTLGTGFVGLVDVDALDGTTEVGGSAGWIVIGGWAADGVVEDEDFGSAGTRGIMLI